MKKWLIVLIILVLIAVSAAVYYLQNYRFMGCTKEAKICPNGRGVGRVGPNCEFAPCELPASLEECETKEGFWKDWCYHDYAMEVVPDQDLRDKIDICNIIERNYLKEECIYRFINDK